MVMVSHSGIVATCAASHPRVPDFSCGFQFHLASGTRSKTFRVFFISSSNSGNSIWLKLIDPPAKYPSQSRQNYRRIKSELSRPVFSRAFLLFTLRKYTTFMAHQRTDSYLQDSLAVFRYYKKLGENAMAQCPDEG